MFGHSTLRMAFVVELKGRVLSLIFSFVQHIGSWVA